MKGLAIAKHRIGLECQPWPAVPFASHRFLGGRPMAKLRILLVATMLLLPAIAAWPGTGVAAQNRKPSQPTAKPDLPPALPPLFESKKEPIKVFPPPASQPPPFIQSGGPGFPSPKDVEKQREIEKLREIAVKQRQLVRN